MLIINSDQVAALDENAINDFYKRILEFLMHFFGNELGKVDQKRVYDFIKYNKVVAEDHGIFSERGLSMWVFLCLATKKKFYLDETVKSLFVDKSKSELNILGLFDRLVEMQFRQEEKL